MKLCKDQKQDRKHAEYDVDASDQIVWLLIAEIAGRTEHHIGEQEQKRSGNGLPEVFFERIPKRRKGIALIVPEHFDDCVVERCACCADRKDRQAAEAEKDAQNDHICQLIQKYDKCVVLLKHICSLLSHFHILLS